MSDNLYQQWLDAKQCERDAVDRRRAIEDQLADAMQITEGGEGITSLSEAGYKIKVTQRLSRKVNSNTLQEIAAENGLSEHLGSLFRWTPAINAKAWNDADQSITAPLLDAITTTAGRPSFSIEAIED